MANARTCDGPSCEHVGSANPEGWIVVSIGPVHGDAFPDSEMAGTYDFQTIECFEEWLAQYLPKPETPDKPTRTRKRG